MRTLVIPVTLTAVSLASAGAAAAQQSSAIASNVPVTADIVAAITIRDTGSLNFGQIVAGSSGGTVTLTPLNTRSSIGGAKLANGIGTRAATFDVTGAEAGTFAITLPASPVKITSGANEMTVDTFVTPSPTLALVDGVKSFAVGASLTVAANQPSGHYAGTFDVTVAYD